MATRHDATRVLLGGTSSSEKVVSCEAADPASFPAGVAVRRSSTGGLLIASDATAALIGVSLGADLADTLKTAVCRTGNWVPILLAAYLVKDKLTFTVKAAASTGVSIEFLDTGTKGAESVTVVDNVISVSMEDGASTCTELKAAIDGYAAAAALISVAIASGQGATAQAAFAEDDIDTYSPAKGAVVKVSATTGLATTLGDTTSAKYLTGALDAISATTGAIIGKAAYIDMGGGL